MRYIGNLGGKIVVGHKTSTKFLLLMEGADGGTLKDPITHVSSFNPAHGPKFVLPAGLLCHVLASIIEAVLYLETSLTMPMQYIDCHIGNVVFLRRPSPWHPVKSWISIGSILGVKGVNLQRLGS